jgi:hypothetical protein
MYKETDLTVSDWLYTVRSVRPQIRATERPIVSSHDLEHLGCLLT